MIKLLIVNQFGNGVIKKSNVMPRIGDQVDLFYKPYPKVTNILLWPGDDLKKQLSFEDIDIDAIISVT
jgi:hypothetical protein